MIELINDHVFHLKNEKISYIFCLLKNQQLGHLYFGPALKNVTEEDISYLTKKENKSAGTVKYFEDDSLFTLSDQYQEFPVYGTSDFKEGMIEIFEDTTPLYPDFTFDSYEIVQGKERFLEKPSSFADQGAAESIIVRLVDEERALTLELTYTIFQGMSSITRNQKIKNLSETPRKLTRFMSGALEMKNTNYEFVHLSGAWLKERHIKTRSLAQGVVSVGSLKGASGHQHNPFVALKASDVTNETGKIYGANLIYSGNFLAQAEVDEWENVRLMSGIHPHYFSWKLEQEESFEAPEFVLTYTDKGWNGLMHASAQFTEKHIINPAWQQKERPIVLNNWEATYFDFDHQKLIELAKEGKRLGIECFVLDDGWFGKRNHDRTSLGDWFVDQDKFPKGINAFAEEIHQMGLQLGIWFEPEMISPDSQLYQMHPDWVVRHPYPRVSIGRGQYVLDFSNPEVVSHIYQQMKIIIEGTKLEYIKWDMNRNITEAYSHYLAEEKIDQTEFFHRYILGVYQLYQNILTDFPHILIEGCAGGGGRFDLGILFYSPQIWPSDDSDAVERLSIQSGTLLAYPLSSFSNHVSACPNHQTGRVTSLQMRQQVAMFGPLGYELNLFELSEAEKCAIKENIAFYKKHRQLLTFGNFYQFITREDKNEFGWAVYNEQSRQALVGFFRILAEPNGTANEFVPLPFIKPEIVYNVNGEKITGTVLKNIGLRKPYQFNGVNHGTAQVTGDFQSYIYELIPKKAT